MQENVLLGLVNMSSLHLNIELESAGLMSALLKEEQEFNLYGPSGALVSMYLAFRVGVSEKHSVPSLAMILVNLEQ